MNKQELLKKYNEQDKLLLSKILDKIKFTKEKNKISNTDFLNLYEQQITEELLKRLKQTNYIFYGGFNEQERKLLIVYPEKLATVFKYNILNIEEIIKIIRIELPNQMQGKYVHKNYLSGLMKLGIRREKIGDIIVDNSGADIIVKEDALKFLLQELGNLKRFSKSKIYEINIKDVKKQKIEKEQIKIIVPSLRLDSIVSELAKMSRTKAVEIILAEKVLVNYSIQTKTSKEIKIKDIITIRGKGRFTIKEVIGTSKKNNQIILVEKFKT